MKSINKKIPNIKYLLVTIVDGTEFQRKISFRITTKVHDNILSPIREVSRYSIWEPIYLSINGDPRD